MRKVLGFVVLGGAAPLSVRPVPAVASSGRGGRQLAGIEVRVAGVPAGAGEQFKVHEGTMAHLRRLQLEGKIIEIDSAGIIRIR